MTTATHYENANFLRELAESLPRLRPQGHSQSQADLLQRLADDELAQAQHEEWVRAKVAAARADNRPPVTTDEVKTRLGARFDRLIRASRWLERLAEYPRLYEAAPQYGEGVRRISLVGQHVLYEVDDQAKAVKVLSVVGQRQNPKPIR